MTTTSTGEPRAAAIREEAESLLRPLADLAAPVAPGTEAPWDQLLRVRDHDIERAADCAASIGFDVGFDGWRAATARRTLANLALDRLTHATADPASVVVDVVAAEARAARTSLGRWLAELGPGGTAAVVRAATARTIAARSTMTRWPPAPGTTFGDRFTWRLPGRAVQLEATVDAVTRPSRSLLVFARGERDDAARREVAWPALVATLSAGAVPATVTRIDLASGARRTVPITDDVLDAGLTHAAVGVAAVVATAFTGDAEPTPGPWCRRCRGLEVCPDGGPWRVARSDHLPHAR